MFNLLFGTRDLMAGFIPIVFARPDKHLNRVSESDKRPCFART